MLSDKGIGCHLHGQFVGAFVYADDVTLLASTSTALNAMLETCSSFASDFDLQFNSSKTKCIYIFEEQWWTWYYLFYEHTNWINEEYIIVRCPYIKRYYQ